MIDKVLTRLFLWTVRNVYWKRLTKYTPNCHMDVCCSRYGYEAVRDNGFRVGIQMAADRLVECRKEWEKKVAQGLVPSPEGRDTRAAGSEPRV